MGPAGEENSRAAENESQGVHRLLTSQSYAESTVCGTQMKDRGAAEPWRLGDERIRRRGQGRVDDQYRRAAASMVHTIKVEELRYEESMELQLQKVSGQEVGERFPTR